MAQDDLDEFSGVFLRTKLEGKYKGSGEILQVSIEARCLQDKF